MVMGQEDGQMTHPYHVLHVLQFLLLLLLIIVHFVHIGFLQHGTNKFGKKADEEGFEFIEEKLPLDSGWSLFHDYGGNIQTFVSSEKTGSLASTQWVGI